MYSLEGLLHLLVAHMRSTHSLKLSVLGWSKLPFVCILTWWTSSRAYTRHEIIISYDRFVFVPMPLLHLNDELSTYHPSLVCLWNLKSHKYTHISNLHLHYLVPFLRLSFVFKWNLLLYCWGKLLTSIINEIKRAGSIGDSLTTLCFTFWVYISCLTLHPVLAVFDVSEWIPWASYMW